MLNDKFMTNLSALTHVHLLPPRTTQLLSTTEGKEGMIKALQAAARKDMGLAVQLRMMLGSDSGGGVPGAAGPSNAFPAYSGSAKGTWSFTGHL